MVASLLFFIALIIFIKKLTTYKEVVGACEKEKQETEDNDRFNTCTPTKSLVPPSQEAPKNKVLGITGSSTIYKGRKK